VPFPELRRESGLSDQTLNPRRSNAIQPPPQTPPKSSLKELAEHTDITINQQKRKPSIFNHLECIASFPAHLPNGVNPSISRKKKKEPYATHIITIAHQKYTKKGRRIPRTCLLMQMPPPSPSIPRPSSLHSRHRFHLSFPKSRPVGYYKAASPPLASHRAIPIFIPTSPQKRGPLPTSQILPCTSPTTTIRSPVNSPIYPLFKHTSYTR
jgi:hypothetical protein